jgi:hypothetical protein
VDHEDGEGRAVVKRYSKKVREEAALICAIAASTPRYRVILTDVASDLDVSGGSDSLSLACAAWWHPSLFDADWNTTRAAEAEALIRTGWSPK